MAVGFHQVVLHKKCLLLWTVHGLGRSVDRLLNGYQLKQGLKKICSNHDMPFCQLPSAANHVQLLAMLCI